MKIERISENQLKLTLTKADLVERNIQLEDLISPSEKTQKLFRDIMEQTLEEYDFITDNTPVMVEAAPAGMEGIMIIITKVDAEGKGKQTPSMEMLSQVKDPRKFKKKPLDVAEEKDVTSNKLLIYSFDSLDVASKAALHLNTVYQGESSLYKSNDRFFLVLQIDTYSADHNIEHLQFILEEYGQKHVSTSLSKYYLLEHGESLIAEGAVGILAETFGD